jgi:hypothetical protein
MTSPAARAISLQGLVKSSAVTMGPCEQCAPSTWPGSRSLPLAARKPAKSA